MSRKLTGKSIDFSRALRCLRTLQQTQRNKGEEKIASCSLNRLCKPPFHHGISSSLQNTHVPLEACLSHFEWFAHWEALLEAKKMVGT